MLSKSKALFELFIAKEKRHLQKANRKETCKNSAWKIESIEILSQKAIIRNNHLRNLLS